MPSGVILMFAGFEIAMDDPLLVRGVERVGNLPRDRERFGDGIGACAAMRSASVSPSTSSSTSASDTVRFLDTVNRARCADDSATRAGALRARTARVDPDRRRTPRAGP